MTTAAETELHGRSDPRFAPVRAAFEQNFAERGEVGAAVAVFHHGEPVVDLWGGRVIRDQKPAEAWQSDTIVRMMSVNKGITAILGHMLADRGLLDYAKPVAAYWPEFAEAGKADITVGTLMSGMAALVYADHVEPDGAFDFDAMVAGLAKQEPNWPPGTQGAYHSATYGHLVGELIRRITGKSPGTFFKDEFALPLGLDYWFALPKSEWPRLSEVLPNPGSATLNAVAQGGSTNLGRAWRVYGRYTTDRDNTAILEKEMPSSAGRGNARAVAKLFAALAEGGTLDGVTLMSPATIERMTKVQWDGPCALTGRHYRYAMGLFANQPETRLMGPNPQAFGHAGLGGALGFADPSCHLSFSFSPNFMCAGASTGERCQALVDAAFASL